jgi:hypothetical protein
MASSRCSSVLWWPVLLKTTEGVESDFTRSIPRFPPPARRNAEIDVVNSYGSRKRVEDCRRSWPRRSAAH